MSGDLVGQRFSMLTVLSLSHRDSSRASVWVVLCDCGQTTTARNWALKAGKKKSCGCQTGRFQSEGIRQQGSAIKALYRQHTGMAKAREDIPLSFTDWLGIAQNPCTYCAANEPNLSYVNAAKTRATRDQQKTHLIINDDTAPRLNGVDRIDSTKSYSVENCTACCSMCNRMKNHYPLEYWLNQMRRILSNQQTKDKS